MPGMIADPYLRAKFSHRPHGHILVDGVVRADTHQCAHCGAHFMVIAGERGFCRNCMQTTCGQASCDECKPIHAKLEAVERGKRQTINGGY